MNIEKILAIAFMTALLGACGTAPMKTVYVDRPVPAVVTPFPAARVPSAAPQSSKVRCESLLAMAIQAEKATIKQLLIEIQHARQNYADCANRHNVLVDFNEKLEKGLIEVLNYYSSQLPRK